MTPFPHEEMQAWDYPLLPASAHRACGHSSGLDRSIVRVHINIHSAIHTVDEGAGPVADAATDITSVAT